MLGTASEACTLSSVGASVKVAIFGTEGPGSCVDCVTVVTALETIGTAECTGEEEAATATIVTEGVAAMALGALLEADSSVGTVSCSPCPLAAGGWSGFPMLQVTVVAVWVVPVSCVSQGGFEQTCCVGAAGGGLFPILEEDVVAVLVVLVSWVSHGGLEHTRGSKVLGCDSDAIMAVPVDVV